MMQTVRSKLSWLFPLVTVALFACGGDPSGSGGSGGSGGGSGGSGGGGGEGGGGQMCSGDEAIWNGIQKAQPGNTSIPCTTNADCCFVVNDCICSFVVVNAADFQSAKDNWYYCTPECGQDCIYQGVKLECVAGMCQTTEGSSPADGFEFGDHCGK